jgi:hypothetical protein
LKSHAQKPNLVKEGSVKGLRKQVTIKIEELSHDEKVREKLKPKG